MRKPPTMMGAVVAAGLVCSALFWPQPVRAQVKLEYKFPEGQKLTYKTTSRTRQVLSFNGMAVEAAQRETKVWSRSVGKRNKDSALPIEEKVDALHVEYTLPNEQKLTLDSGSPQFKIENPELAFLGDVVKLDAGFVAGPEDLAAARSAGAQRVASADPRKLLQLCEIASREMEGQPPGV